MQFDPQTRQEQSKKQKHSLNPLMNIEWKFWKKKNELMTLNLLMYMTIQGVPWECSDGSMLENLTLGPTMRQAKGKKANGQHRYLRKMVQPTRVIRRSQKAALGNLLSLMNSINKNCVTSMHNGEKLQTFVINL